MYSREMGSDSPYQRNDIFIEKTSRFVLRYTGVRKAAERGILILLIVPYGFTIKGCYYCLTHLRNLS